LFILTLNIKTSRLSRFERERYMQKFRDLYITLTKSAMEQKLNEAITRLEKGDFDSHHLDCLLNPAKIRLSGQFATATVAKKNVPA